MFSLLRASTAAVRVTALRPALARQAHTSSYDWEDPLLLREQLDDEERAISQMARDYCQEKLLPRVTGMRAGVEGGAQNC